MHPQRACSSIEQGDPARMDTAALVTCDFVLAERSFRGAARRLGRPVATVASAVRRVEVDLSVDLVQGEGNSLSITLEARRLSDTFAHLRDGILAMFGDDGRAPDGREAGSPDARLRRAAATAVPLAALRHLCVTLEAGSIRGAALRIGMGQPQLARQLKRLEHHFGRDLIERHQDGSRATPEGRRIADLAAALLTEWQSLIATAARDFRRRDRTIRFGSIVPLGHESQIARMLANLLAHWENGPGGSDRASTAGAATPARGSRPTEMQRPLFLSSGTAEELVADLKTRRLDFSLVDASAEAMGLAGIPIGASPLCLVGPRGFARGRTPLDILLDERVAVPSARSGLRSLVRSMLEGLQPGHGGPVPDGTRFDRTPANFSEVDSLPVIINLVRDHGFVSVLPQPSVNGIGGAIESQPLDVWLPLWLVWLPSRDLAPTAERIAAILRAQ
jgi:DNA-binding transcriptional LysR family regulator